MFSLLHVIAVDSAISKVLFNCFISYFFFSDKLSC